jgi:hypothetical protein
MGTSLHFFTNLVDIEAIRVLFSCNNNCISFLCYDQIMSRVAQAWFCHEFTNADSKFIFFSFVFCFFRIVYHVQLCMSFLIQLIAQLGYTYFIL